MGDTVNYTGNPSPWIHTNESFQSVTELSVNIYEVKRQITLRKCVLVSTLIMSCVSVIIVSRLFGVVTEFPGCVVI